MEVSGVGPPRGEIVVCCWGERWPGIRLVFVKRLVCCNDDWACNAC